jgi:hypothetical protein
MTKAHTKLESVLEGKAAQEDLESVPIPEPVVKDPAESVPKDPESVPEANEYASVHMDVQYQTDSDDARLPSSPDPPKANPKRSCQKRQPNLNVPPRRSARIAAKQQVSSEEFADEGGRLLMSVLDSDLELEVDLREETLPIAATTIANTEATYDVKVMTALTEPIDDPDAKDPQTIHEAKRSVYWTEWLAAIHEELEALRVKGVYEDIEEIPPGRRAIDSKWVLHIKRNKEGQIARFKARLVAKGFTQIPGQDFTHTFAPVARWDSVRVILVIGATLDWELRHIDIKTAFLNGPLTEEIYMRKPEILGRGYWRLRKGLYGLKQAGRQWSIELNNKLEMMQFKRIQADWSVHIRKAKPDAKSTSGTTVDDMLIGSNSVPESNWVSQALQKYYEITDYGEVSWILGCRITRWRERRTLKVDQESYTLQILRDFGMDKAKPVSTPMPPKVRLTSNMCPQTDEEKRMMKQEPYDAVVGKLMYLTTCTRPDIAYAVRELARFMGNPGEMHWKCAKHVLRYLCGTANYGLLLGNVDEPYPLFRGLTDSDWGMGDQRKSVSGYVVLMGNSPIAWSSKQQATVALSSCEAEYLASAHCARQLIWLRYLLEELGYPQTTATPLFCDNQGTIACTHDPHSHTQMKHIDIRAHFIRDCVNKRLIDVHYISNQFNTADLLTKPLGKVLHQQWVRLLKLNAGQGGVLTDDPAGTA